jgi:F420-dependent oxidoreductase-like protein
VANELPGLFIMVEPQEGSTYDEIVALAQKAEALGFEGFFRSDHYMPVNSNIPPTAVSTECWATLAGLARDTKRVRLGTMISPMTFRYPGEFAKIVATIDQMSGGRVEVGMGGGWYKREHEAYGLPFPDAKGRMDILEDTLEICTRLWSDGVGHTYQGRVFSVTDSPGSPKPTQRPHPPIVIGGGGERRTPRLAAQFGDEFNTFGGINTFNTRKQRVVDACAKIGRDPSTIKFTAACVTVVGTSEADLKRRVQIRLDFNHENEDAGDWIAKMRKDGWLIGTVDQVAEQVKELKAAGAQRIYFQLVPVNDHGMLDIIANDLAPKCS